MAECSKCGKEFRDAYSLRRHEARKTPCAPILEKLEPEQNKAHTCRYCRRSFASKPSAARHMRQYCKIANSDEGMEKLLEHTMQRQMQTLTAQNAALQAQVGRLADLMEKQLSITPPGGFGPTQIGTLHANTVNAGSVTMTNQVDARHTTNNININIVGFDRDDRIYIPVALVKAAFTENPRLIEYCRLSDDERVDAERAAPYVLEALVDLVRRAHRDPVYRNIYLSPKRADQVMVCLDEERGPPQRDRGQRGEARLQDGQGPQKWEVRPLVEAIRLLFDGVAENLHKIIITDHDRAQLPFDVQSAASWVPNLYEDEPERFVKDGKAPMAAHFQNTRPLDAT
jgi:hypothetical protein